MGTVRALPDGRENRVHWVSWLPARILSVIQEKCRPGAADPTCEQVQSSFASRNITFPSSTPRRATKRRSPRRHSTPQGKQNSSVISVAVSKLSSVRRGSRLGVGRAVWCCAPRSAYSHIPRILRPLSLVLWVSRRRPSGSDTFITIFTCQCRQPRQPFWVLHLLGD
jgi:hypothetical protein